MKKTNLSNPNFMLNFTNQKSSLIRINNLENSTKKSFWKLLLIASLSLGIGLPQLTGYGNSTIKNVVLENSPFANPPSALVSISSGSFIINMGVTPQTYANGLKPYGLIYDMLKNYNVPVYWVIADAKAKDGIDFSHNGIDYKGGAFIIPAEYRSATVNAAIASWQGQGVVGATTVSTFTEDVDYTLTSAPTWVLDFEKGDLAKPAFSNAGIPNSAYSEKIPSALDCCDYMYVMPHADPTWGTHSRLYSWMKDKALGTVNGEETCRGWFWGACHAVSVIEELENPGMTQRMNFLSQEVGAGTIDPDPDVLHFKSHDDGSPAYVYDYATHPFMQFMDVFDGATENGSEQIYLPDIGAEWRPGFTIGTEDQTQVDVPGNSPGEAVKLAWGEAWGNVPGEGGSNANNTPGSENFTTGNGWAMYSGGHSFTKGSVTQNVAIQRSFFNYSLISALERGSTITYTTPAPASIASGTSVNLVAEATGNASPFGFEWIATPNVGTFSAPNPVTGVAANTPASVTYTPPTVAVNTDVIISLILTDACGNTSRVDNNVVVTPPSPQPPVCNSITETNPPNATLVTDLTTLVTDPDAAILASGFSIISNPTLGTVALDASGNATYTPNFNNALTDMYTYQYCDADGQCCNNVVTINTACPTNANTQIFGTVFYDGIGSVQGVIDGADYGYGTGAQVRLYQDNGVIGVYEPGTDIELANSPANTNSNGGYVFSLNNTPTTTATVMTSIAADDDDIGAHPGNLLQHAGDATFRVQDDNDPWFGLRFQVPTIPQGATITDVTIELNPTTSETNASTIDIYVLDEDDAPTIPDLLNAPYNVSGLEDLHPTFLSSSVNWVTPAPIVAGNVVSTSNVNITSLVQDIINKPGWAPNNYILFVMNTTNTNGNSDDWRVEAFENSDNDPAKLTIEYSVPGTPATGDYVVLLDAPSVLPFVPTPVGTPTQHFVNIASVGDSDCFNDFGATDANNPPQAFDVTAPSMQSCAAQASITALNATDPDVADAIDFYTIKTLPNSGTLYYQVGGAGAFVPINAINTNLDASTEMPTLQFDPNPAFKGTVTFTYSATDDNAAPLESNTATYSIVITNCPPTTDDRTNDPISSSAGNTPLSVPSGSILQGDDPDGSVVCFEINSIPPASEGVLLFDADGVGPNPPTPVVIGQNIAIADIGNLIFAPSGSFIGNVTFTYSAKDDDGAVDATPATYTIPIINTPPVAVDITHPICILAGGGAQIIDPLIGTDVDGTIASYNIFGLSGGALSMTGVITPPDHTTLTFTVASPGTYTFSYTATDNNGAVSNTATYTINVSTAPVANNISTPDIPSTAGSTPIPATSASDDGSIVEYIFQTIPDPVTQGVLYLNNPPLTPIIAGDPIAAADIGKLEFDPISTFAGSIVLDYLAEDDCGFSSPLATYTINVVGADLSLLKVVSNTSPGVGNPVTFTITVNNAGPSIATGVSVGDVVPNGYGSVINISDPGTGVGVLAGNIITWTGITVPVAGSVVLTFDATVLAPGSGVTHLNHAEIAASDQFDPDSTPDATPDSDTPTEDDEATAEVFLPILTISKTANKTTGLVLGDVITYTYVVTNTGNVDINNVSVADVHPGSGPDPVPGTEVLTNTSGLSSNTVPNDGNVDLLAPGDVITLTGTYTVTQADLNAGVAITNTATANGTPTDGTLTPPTDTETITPTPNPTLGITKTASKTTGLVLGDVITYTYVVTNTGNVSINNVTVGDVHPGSGPDPVPDNEVLTNTSGLSSNTVANDGNVDVLAPGDVITLTGTYTVTQNDLDAGVAITNTATANGTPTSGTLTPPTDTETITPTPAPAMTITKTANKTTGLVLGDVITYTYVVTNTGNVSINNVSVADVHPGSGPDPIPGTEILTNTSGLSVNTTANDGNINKLAPGDVVTMTGTYTVTQFDLDAGVAITNTATANGTPTSGTLTPPTDTETITPTPAPAMTITKTANKTTGLVLGDVITYTYVVTNTGNVSINNVNISDVHPGSGPDPIPGSEVLTNTSGLSTNIVGNDGIINKLAPGDFVTMTGTYIVTQADLDAGVAITNTATANGTPTSGTLIPPTDTETITPTPAPAMTIVKTADKTTGLVLGDVITYTYIVSNTGNVSINNVTVADVHPGSGPDPTPGSEVLTNNSGLSNNAIPNDGNINILAPGDFVSYTGTYTVTQADLDAGVAITNTATANGTPTSGTLTPPTDTETITPTSSPAMTIAKTANKTTGLVIGDVITYTYIVTNTGNVSINNVTVADVHPGSGPAPSPNNEILTNTSGLSSNTIANDGNIDVLAPGDFITMTGTYTVTQADLDAGVAITNTATANGTPTSGTLTPPTDTETITPTPAPAMTITKTGDVLTGLVVGNLVTYTYVVTNTGNVSINNVTVADVHPGSGPAPSPNNEILTNTSGLSVIQSQNKYMLF